jgi:uncharacterized protein YbcI
MPIAKSKGQIEAEITEAIVKFEREYMGRGPKEARTYIVDDIILVRLRGVLTPAEQQLGKDKEGILLIKQMRQTLLESARGILETLIKDITQQEVVSIHADVSAKTGERIIVFSLEGNLERQLKG